MLLITLRRLRCCIIADTPMLSPAAADDATPDIRYAIIDALLRHYAFATLFLRLPPATPDADISHMPRYDYVIDAAMLAFRYC